MEFFTLGFERGDQGIESGIKLLKFEQRGQAHGGGEDVVGGLSVIDVVVGMGVLVLAEVATQQFRGAIGDDLVGVHVEADAGSGLKDVDYKGMVPLALLHFSRSLNDGVGGLGIDES